LRHRPHLESIGVAAVCGAGSRCDPPKFPGVAHFVEHLLYRSNISDQENNISKTVFELGGETNGQTDISSTSFTFYMHHWDETVAIDSLADIICDLPDSPDIFNLEKSVVLQELQLMGESSQHNLSNIILNEMFHNDEFKHTPGGTKRSIKKLKYKDTKEFYQRWYTSGNIVISVAGNFDREKILELIESRFSSIPQGKNEPSPAKRIRKGKRYRLIYAPLPMSYITITYPCIDMQSVQLSYLHLLENIFCNGPQSRLYQLLREKEGLVYGFDSGTLLAQDFGILSVTCPTHPKNCYRVIKNILSESERLSAEGVSEFEFERAKKMCLRGCLLMKDHPLILAHWYAVQKLHSTENNPNTLSEFVKELEEATPEKANRIAQGIFSTNRSFTVVTGGLSLIKRIRIKRLLKKSTKQANQREQ